METAGNFDVPRATRSGLRRKLLSWYAENKRSLPFRQDPTPYAVWVSEVMLQQTRVETVKPYFEAWMSRFPDLATLARAREEEVMTLWQGLGYYSRARRLLAGARYVMLEFSGELPALAEELVQIPGIGPYTAGAISSIAYGRASPIVDGNVIRVLTRVLGLRGDPTRAPLKMGLWQVAGVLVPRGRPGDFNQAMMELGALVCTPRRPVCLACPWRGSCIAHEEGSTASLPELPSRAKATSIAMVLVLLRHRGRYAVQSLEADARWWAGLSAFPFLGVPEGASDSQVARDFAKQVTAGGELDSVSALSPFVHTVTRYRIKLSPFVVQISSRKKGNGYRWLSLGQLRGLAMPAPHRNVLNLLLGEVG